MNGQRPRDVIMTRDEWISMGLQNGLIDDIIDYIIEEVEVSKGEMTFLRSHS